MTSIHAQSENQQRLFDALRLISDKNDDVGDLKASSHSMPDHPTLFSDNHLLPSSGFDSSVSAGDHSDPAGITLDFQDTSDSTLSYDPINTVPHERPLQVDHNGARVGEHSSSSAWVPSSAISDLTRSLAMSTCSSVQCSPRLPASATVFAAAVTAAMIVDRPDGSPKRPRSPSSESVDEDYLGDDDTDGHSVDEADDDTTDTSSDDSEDVYYEGANSEMRGSPRTVLPFFKPPLSIPSAASHSRSFNQQISQSTIGPPSLAAVAASPSRTVTNRDESVLQASGLGREAVRLPVDIESSQNVVISRKRRAEAMERFRRKKAVRCYGRQRVRYQIRKRIATTRPRVNGRFARRVDAEPKGNSNSMKE